MLKIAYLIPRIKDSGLTRIPYYLAQAFLPHHQVTFFYLSSAQEPYLDLGSFEIRELHLFKFDPYLNQFDIVHSHGFIPDLYLALHQNQLTAKTVTTVHGYHIQELVYAKGFIKGQLIGRLWDFIFHRLDKAVYISKSLETYYHSKGIVDGVTIYNGIPLPKVDMSYELRPNLNWSLNEDSIVISTVSILNRRKGVDQIIKLLTYDKNLFLMAIGGEKSDVDLLRSYATELGVFDQCFFFGFDFNPWQIAIFSHVFIFPSRSEGFGLSLVEAARLNLPIICSDIPIFRELFTEEEVSFFELENIDDLYQKLKLINKDKPKIVKANQKALNSYSLESMQGQYLRLYSDLLAIK